MTSQNVIVTSSSMVSSDVVLQPTYLSSRPYLDRLNTVDSNKKRRNKQMLRIEDTQVPPLNCLAVMQPYG